MSKLRNLVCMVTGGSSGLGRATVENFIRNGSKVVISDLPNSNGHSLAKELGENKCVFHPTDVTSEADVTAAIDLAKHKFGGLNVLVNSAGIAIPNPTYNMQTKAVHSLDEFQRVMNVNVAGTFNAIRLACPAFALNEPNADGQRGVIVNTASIAGYDGQEAWPSYVTSKGAIIAMTLPVARDLSGLGVRVMTIAPGFFDTPMLDTLPEDVK